MQRTYRESKKLAHYILNMLPVLNLDALFSDLSGNYVSPAEPEIGAPVTIRVRTAKANVDEVYLVSGLEKKAMDLESSDREFDFYTTRVTLSDRTFSYYFEIHSGGAVVCLLRYGVSDVPDEHSFFRICPGFHTPDWAKGAVMYQIYTDRFCNGDPSNDPLDDEYFYINRNIRRVRDWDRLPERMDVGNFYGGDLEGVRKKLDYLQDLGVEVLYFNPLFVSPSNHKYDTQDYEHIDPHFTGFARDEGDLLTDGRSRNTEAGRYICRTTLKENLEAADAYFADFVGEVHKRGMRVILDGVFNHCGSFNRWLDREQIYEQSDEWEKGAYVSADSPYRKFFAFRDQGAWPCNRSYAGWWDHDTLPKLNYDECPELVDRILAVARKWVSPPYNADGWRLDVAADLGRSAQYNHGFWKMFRKAVRSANPDALILAEHYGSARDWLQGDQWDSIMNYDAFMEPVSWFFTGMEKHSDEYLPDQVGNADSFFGAMRYHMANFMEPTLLTTMNELSNHDHSRFLTRTNHVVGRVDNFDHDAASEGVSFPVMREAMLCQMTWPGAPTLYYGDEAGVCGFTDPDNRRTYPWGRENRDLLAFTRDVIRLHKAYPALKGGSLKFLHGQKDCIAYGRFDRDQSLIIVFSISPDRLEVSLPVWQAAVPPEADLRGVFGTDRAGYRTDRKIHEDGNETESVTEPETFPVTRGILHLTLQPQSGAVFLYTRKGEDTE